MMYYFYLPIELNRNENESYAVGGGALRYPIDLN